MPPDNGSREAAPAKVNLFLHVTGRRTDGYHLLESLVAFAGIGDSLLAETARGLSLSVTGPFADALGAGADNLVLRAAETLARRSPEGSAPGAAMLLTKSLPIASGIGGGSADAAAALRLLNRLWRLDLAPSTLESLALPLGADIPVCVASQPRLMRGIGDALAPAPELPRCWIVLANPLRGLETRTVFQTRDAAFTPPQIVPARFDDFAGFCSWLRTQTRNDLEALAERLLPVIRTLREALAAHGDAGMVRMSGSGATCFALFEREAQAESARAALARAHTGWWIEAGPLGAADQRSRRTT